VSRPLTAIGVATTLSVALVVLYLALGGASYSATPVADPCATRTLGAQKGVQEAIEQIVLSTADGAACALGVSREELVLALGSGDDLAALADRHNISRDDTERAVRQGLLRAISDAERAHAINGSLADTLRGAVELLPLSTLLALLRDASSLLQR
jgi:hypothetical protein